MVNKATQEMRDNEGKKFRESDALFNPFYTAALISTACFSNSENNGSGIAWPSAYLLLPIVLHPRTVSTIKTDERITLSRWAIDNKSVLGDINRRVVMMAPYTLNGIRTAMRYEHVEVSRGHIKSVVSPRKTLRGLSPEVTRSVKAAAVFGRWMAQTDIEQQFFYLGLER